MTKRTRAILFFGVLAFGMSGPNLSDAQVSNSPVNQQPRADQANPQDVQPSTGAKGEQQGSGKDQNRCDHPEADNGPDICAQWAAANAARKSAELAQVGLSWSIASFLALVLTLIATAWAAWAAARAARTAERSVAITEAAAERQLRAYIGVDRAYITDFQIGKPVIGELILKNFGATPGNRCKTALHFQPIYIEDGNLPETNEPKDEQDIESIFWPNSETHIRLEFGGTLDDKEQMLFTTGDLFLAVRVEVDYIDVFGKHRNTKAHMYCTRGSRKFVFAAGGNTAT